ncbi:hypothetical protein GN958_ATG13699 [Phytophthora infestans]|uniref:RxLR effector PexRD54 WY domain-containing protein n=1 Tax=Phytophthora infestans TaxID=4787 RepID=A0A8S9U7P1_PHYIN|nr:hypothetical protein GN958_ATG13699 [Phytophthora infestans]
MIQNGRRVDRLKSIALKLEAGQTQHWIATRKNPEEVFRFFNLHKISRTLLSEREFTAWVKYTDEMNLNPEAMIAILTKYYPEQLLLQLIQTGKSVDKTKAIATSVEEKLLQTWLKARKSPESALDNLDLGVVTNTLLESPFLNTWRQYIELFNTKNPSRQTTMIKSFTDKFGVVDVATMISAAKSKAATKNIATELESAQLNTWLISRKSADNVYELLQLYKSKRDFSRNPLLGVWVSYMNTLVTKNSEEVSSMLSILKTRFGDRPLVQILREAENFSGLKDAATKLQRKNIQDIFAKSQQSWFMSLRANYKASTISDIIEKAFKDPNTVGMAKAIERARVKEWLKEDASPRGVFRLLQLNTLGPETILSRKFDIWVRYLNEFNKRHPDQKTTVINDLRANYEDKDILKIFAVAKGNRRFEKLVENLETELVNKWVIASPDPRVLRSRLRRTNIDIK